MKDLIAMRLKYKKSYKYTQNHIQDNFLNMGYRYWEKGVLNKVISPELYANPVHDATYRQIDRLFVYLINLVKQIRTQYSIAHDKDTIMIN